MNDSRILAIILNWQQPETTIECVQSLRSMKGPRLDILVIDNGSKDDSPSLLNDSLIDASFLELPENLGFAGGANVGLRKALDEGYDHCLLINNDAFPARDMLTRLIAQLSEDIALLSPKILYESQPDKIWFAGASQDPNSLELRGRAQGTSDGPQWMESRDVDYLLGTCLLVNLDAVKEVGLMDDRFFMYYEDLDWSIRFRKAGYRLRLVADAHLYHRVSVSSGGTNSPLRRYHLARNGTIFYHKHSQDGRPLFIILLRFGSAMKTLAELIFYGHLDCARAYLRGLQDGLRVARSSKG